MVLFNRSEATATGDDPASARLSGTPGVRLTTTNDSVTIETPMPRRDNGRFSSDHSKEPPFVSTDEAISRSMETRGGGESNEFPTALFSRDDSHRGEFVISCREPAPSAGRTFRGPAPGVPSFVQPADGRGIQKSAMVGDRLPAPRDTVSAAQKPSEKTIVTLWHQMTPGERQSLAGGRSNDSSSSIQRLRCVRSTRKPKSFAAASRNRRQDTHLPRTRHMAPRTHGAFQELMGIVQDMRPWFSETEQDQFVEGAMSFSGAGLGRCAGKCR